MTRTTKYCLNIPTLEPLFALYSHKELAEKLHLHYVWFRCLVSPGRPPERKTVGPALRRKFLALYQSALGVSPDFDTLFQKVP